MRNCNEALLMDLRQTFQAAANLTNALPMQRYMKSTMPFHGIQATERRKLQQQVFGRHLLAYTAELIATASTLCSEAQFREERYAAIDLPAFRAFRKLETLRCLPMYRDWIVQGAWWDFCDDISGNRIAELLRQHPVEMKQHLLRWARSRDLWLRRAAIICQRTMGSDTDAHLLYACILPSIDSEEFFLRKAIGWALRARAYDAPDEVIAFINEYRHNLSALTKREALRVLLKRGKVTTIPQ